MESECFLKMSYTCTVLEINRDPFLRAQTNVYLIPLNANRLCVLGIIKHDRQTCRMQTYQMPAVHNILS